MADVAQLVRALGCGPGGRGFKTHRSPQAKCRSIVTGFLFGIRYNNHMNPLIQLVDLIGNFLQTILNLLMAFLNALMSLLNGFLHLLNTMIGG
jgi:hypothetical protein